jgi:hypothetical protein
MVMGAVRYGTARYGTGPGLGPVPYHPKEGWSRRDRVENLKVPGVPRLVLGTVNEEK